MADNIETGVEENTGTGSNEAATQEEQQKESAAASQPEEKNPVNDLISQRDKNFNRAKSAEEKVNDLESRLDYLEAEKEKSNYIETLVKKHQFSEREKAILSEASGPDQADKLADTLIAYREDAKQSALEELQTVSETPRLDPDTAKARLKELEGSGNLEEVLSIKQSLR